MRQLRIRCAKRAGAASDRNGVAAVEFAFVAPLIALLLIGTIEFGNVFMVYDTMVHAAREGTRYKSLDGHTGEHVPSSAVTVARGYLQEAYPNLADSFVITEVDSTNYAWVQVEIPVEEVLLTSGLVSMLQDANLLTEAKMTYFNE